MLDKFEEAHFKYDNIIFKFTKKAILVPNLRIFIFASNFTTRQVRRCWRQIWQTFFKIAFQITQDIFCSKFLFLHEMLQLDKLHGINFKYEKYF